MRLPELSFEFPAEYEVVALDRIDSRAYDRALGFPGAHALDRTRELSAGIVVGVRPARGRSWVGVFEVERYGGDVAPRQVFGWPDRRSLCLLDGGRACVIDTFEPERNYEIDVFPIRDLFVAPRQALAVFADFTRLVAYGADGVAWRSEQLAWDDLEIVRLLGDRLLVSGYDPAGNGPRYPTFTVDIRTGVSSDAPYQR